MSGAFLFDGVHVYPIDPIRHRYFDRAEIVDIAEEVPEEETPAEAAFPNQPTAVRRCLSELDATIARSETALDGLSTKSEVLADPNVSSRVRKAISTPPKGTPWVR